MDWLFVGLICALSIAVADAITKYGLRNYSVELLVVLRFGLAAIATTPLLALEPVESIPAPFWWRLLVLVPLEIAAAILYVRALKVSPLSLTLPYLAFTPVFILAPAYLVLGEKVSLPGIAGISLVVIGSYVLNLAPGGGAYRVGWREPLRALAREPGSRMMLAVAMFYSVTTIVAKGALAYVPTAFFVPFYLWCLTLGAALVLRLPLSSIPCRWTPWLPALAVALGLMVYTHFSALQMVEAAYFISVKRLSLLFAVVIGVFLFKEGQPGVRVFGGILITAGVVLVSVP